MKRLKRLDNTIARLERWLVVALLGLMVLFTFTQVVLRGLYTHGNLQWANALMGHLAWSEPMVRLFVLWIVFLGASLITGEDKHIKIDLLSSLLPSRWLALFNLVLSAACALICAVMFTVCLDYIRAEMQFGGAMFLGVPYWVGQSILPVGFFLLLFRFVVRGLEQTVRMTRNAPP